MADIITLDKWIDLGSSIGTLISAIAALYAIWLTIFQRRLSYKPSLIINDTNLEIIIENYNGAISDIKLKNCKLVAKLTNIGMGSAISLKYKWSYDYLKNIEQYYILYTKLFNKNEMHFTYEVVHGVLKATNKNSEYIYSTMENYTEIDYSLPYNIEKEKIEFNITYPAVMIAINKLFLTVKTEDHHILHMNGPDLLIEYKDIEGKKYNVKWATRLKLRGGNFGSTEMDARFTLEFDNNKSNRTMPRFQKIREMRAKFFSSKKTN